VRNFPIMVVSAVEMRKQCLQTALSSGDSNPRHLIRASPLDYGGFAPGPQIKIAGAAIVKP